MCDGELALPDSITQPMKAHVDTLGFFLFDGVCGQSYSKLVVAQNGRGWLLVVEGQGRWLCCEVDAVLGKEECGAVFSLACR
jgi:hypothetical protein